jgi:GNAT superfamily N-acetyltransferase
MSALRKLGRVGCAELVEWAAAEGWNPGLHDAETFYRVDPEAFVGFFEGDTFVGGGAIVRHALQFGFMGLFIVAHEFRGRGIGRQLWYARRNRLLARLDEGATLGMDGVTDMVPFYAAGGFVPHYLSARFELAAPAILPREGPVRPLAEFNRSAIDEIDRRAFPSPRPAYLGAWLEQPVAKSFGYGESPSDLRGFGVVRPCRTGAKIGPLFAESPEVAAALLDALRSGAEGPVYLDVPTPNAAAVGLCEGLGMQKVFECTRMYLGPKPTYDPVLIYGLTSSNWAKSARAWGFA